MDQRQTFKDLKELKAILENLCDQQEKASFLVDREGLTRMEGTIASLELGESLTTAIIYLNCSETSFHYLHEIIAVNGIFRSDYSEC
jgi:hypothetical protein